MDVGVGVPLGGHNVHLPHRSRSPHAQTRTQGEDRVGRDHLASKLAVASTLSGSAGSYVISSEGRRFAKVRCAKRSSLQNLIFGGLVLVRRRIARTESTEQS